jgi:hypothetical protein
MNEREAFEKWCKTLSHPTIEWSQWGAWQAGWQARQEAKPLTVEQICVRRWDPVSVERDDDTAAIMRESRSGDWVSFSDYERLNAAMPHDQSARIAELEAELHDESIDNCIAHNTNNALREELATKDQRISELVEYLRDVVMEELEDRENALLNVGWTRHHDAEVQSVQQAIAKARELIAKNEEADDAKTE